MNTPNKSQPPLIAIIDDEEDITTFVGLVLVDAGFRVLVSNDSETAMPLLEDQQPDLICLDLLMPKYMGSSLFLKLRRNPRLADVPVLIFSGLVDQAEVGNMMARDGKVKPPEGYIEKPIRAEGLLERLRVVLENNSPPATGAET